MRLIDADALKQAFEEDGRLSSYIEKFIDNAATIETFRIACCNNCVRNGSELCPECEYVFEEVGHYKAWTLMNHTKDDGYCNLWEGYE